MMRYISQCRVIVFVLFTCLQCTQQTDLKATKRTTHVPPTDVTPMDLIRSQMSLGHMIVDQNHKIAFCPVEKVASTHIRQLFYRMSGDKLWFMPPYHKPGNLVTFTSMNDTKRTHEIMHDPTWIKAIFFRDPAKRLLSSYLHLIKNPKASPRYKTYIKKFNRSTSWDDFWRLATEKNGLDNPHWKAQVSYCNFQKFYSLYNFVGNYEMIKDHFALLERMAGLQNFTASGWEMTKRIRQPWSAGHDMQWHIDLWRRRGISLEPNPEISGDCMWCSNEAHHKNNYSSNPVDSYLTSSVLHGIRNSHRYQKDYDFFKKITTIPFNRSMYL